METMWLDLLLDKVILLAVLVWGGLALVFGWVVPIKHLPMTTGSGKSPMMPTPALDLDDVLLLVGVKEAQLAVLQRQLTTLQARIAVERTNVTQEHVDA